MIRLHKLLYVAFYNLSLVLLLTACSQTQKEQEAEIVEISFLHINDVYEIAGITDGKYGNMARIAYLKDSLKAIYPNLYLVLSGDFLNPSVFGALQYEGKAIRGRQMIEAMNAAGVDFVTFGNHEFDIKEEELLARIEESECTWISSNVFHQTDSNQWQAFMHRGKPMPRSHVFKLPYNESDTFKIAMLGLCLDYNNPDYTYFTDVNQTAARLTDSLSDITHGVVALTHLNLREDRELARQVPKLRLLMGGHDHDNMYEKVERTVIAKADANARTAYLHHVLFYPKTKELSILSDLISVERPMPLQKNANQVIQKWMRIATEIFKEEGFEPDNVLLTLDSALDLRESEVRHKQGSAGQLFVRALEYALPDADVYVMAGGSVRIDDVLEGSISEYDIMRMLPFAGAVHTVEMSGRTLSRLLDAGEKNKGSGGYLHRSPNLGYEETENRWTLNNEPLSLEKRYTVGLNEYLISGNERNMNFMNPKTNQDLKNISQPKNAQAIEADVRKVLIAYLKSLQ